jgi:hypothetical protein
MNIWLSQCNDFEHVLEPDDGHIGLKHVVQKKTVNCECVKMTDKDQCNTLGCYITDFCVTNKQTKNFGENLQMLYESLTGH